MKCFLCNMERESSAGWLGTDESGDEVFICEHCIEDHITEDKEPADGLYCSLCFEDIEFPESEWIWKRSDNFCICDNCLKKGVWQ